jgi:hypothetical protein
MHKMRTVTLSRSNSAYFTLPAVNQYCVACLLALVICYLVLKMKCMDAHVSKLVMAGEMAVVATRTENHLWI